MKSFRQFLFENRINWLKKNVTDIDTSHDSNAVHTEPHGIIDHFAQHDPTRKKLYTQWMVNQYRKGHTRQEDAPGLHDTLSNFETHKSKLEKRDINQYKHPSELKDSLEPHVEKEESEDPFKHPDHPHPGAEKIHSGKNIDVYNLKNHDAAKHYGMGTSWCTARENAGHVTNEYLKHGPLYLVHGKKDGRRHQLHFQTHQFMNEKDIDKPLNELTKKYPEMSDVREFRGQSPIYDYALEKDPEKKYHLLKTHGLERTSVPDQLDPDHLKRLSDEAPPELGGNLAKEKLAVHSGIKNRHVDHIMSSMKSISKDTHYHALATKLARNESLSSDHAHKLATEHSVSSDVQSDIARRNNLHQKTVDHLTDKVTNNGDVKLASNLLVHQNKKITSDHITKMQEGFDKQYKEADQELNGVIGMKRDYFNKHLFNFIDSKNAHKITHDHIDHALKVAQEHPGDGGPGIAAAVAESTADKKNRHIDKLLNWNHPEVHNRLSMDKNLNKDHIDKIINDVSKWPDGSTNVHTIKSIHSFQENKLTDEHRGKMIDYNHHEIDKSLLYNDKTSPEHVNKIADKYFAASVRGTRSAAGTSDLDYAIGRHQNLSKENQDKIMNDPFGSHRSIQGLASNPNLHPDHIDSLVSNDFHHRHTTRRIIPELIDNPVVKDHHIHKLIDNTDHMPTLDKMAGSWWRDHWTDDHAEKLASKGYSVRNSLYRNEKISNETKNKLKNKYSDPD